MGAVVDTTHPRCLPLAAFSIGPRLRLFRSTPLLAALALCKQTITTEREGACSTLPQTASPVLVHSWCTLACNGMNQCN